MQSYATLAMGGPRWQLLRRTLRFIGRDLTGADFRLQVRQYKNQPGTPLADLATVTTAAAEGVRLISVEDVNGQPVSTVGIRFNETTMEAMPFAGEAGDGSTFAWDMQVTPAGGDKTKWIGGPFIVEGAVTGADAAPLAIPSSGISTSSQPTASAATASFQIGDIVVNVTMGGGEGPAGKSSGPLGAESVGADEIVSSPGDIAAIQNKLGITGSVIALGADLTLDDFSPRDGDAYVLNGHTLTINRMADTPLTGLFRGAGFVILKGGIARPEWWDTTSYRAAAIALTAGGGGDVLLSARRYPSESSGASPLPIANVRLIGVAKPAYAPGFATLMDGSGTILNGPVIVASQRVDGSTLGSGVVIETLGVDSGATVAAGANLEGLIFPNIGPGSTPNPSLALRNGIAIRNVRSLCRAVDSPVHGILVEAAIDPVIENCQTVYGNVGVVLKTRGGTVRRCQMRGHAVAPGLAKSDGYALCTDTLWEDCQASSVTGVDTGPFRVQAATASTSRHTFRDVRSADTTQWISIESLGANNTTDISILGGMSEGTRFGSISVSRINAGDTGVIARVTVNGARITNVLETINGAEYIGHGIYIGAAVDTMTVIGTQITATAGDGMRSYGANVLVTGTVASAPGAGAFGFNALGGTMKVPDGSNVGTTSGSVAA